MPLTFAHPAAVLPLMRGPLVPTALVAGAMSPDLPYFLRATPVPVTAQSWYEPAFNGTTAHGFPGALTVAVPLALLLHLGFVLARRPAVAALGSAGDAHQERGDRPGAGGRPGAAVRGWLVPSAVIGVATHLVWDAFTHADGFVASRLPGMDALVVGDLTWVRLLQHASTALGLTVLVVVAWRRRGGLLAPGRGPRLALVVLAASAVVALGAAVSTAAGWQDRDHLSTRVLVEGRLFDAVTGGGVALLLSAGTAVALWWAVHLTRTAWAGRRP